MKSLKHLTDLEQQAVRLFSKKANALLGNKLVKLKLFGSKVRGDSSSESDIDILIVVRERDFATGEQISEIAADINVTLDVVISPVIYSVHEYERNRYFKTLFIENVEREGVAI